MKILLASQSPSRRKLLAKTGISFETFSPDIQEERLLDAKNPAQSCQNLSHLKALKAQKKYPTHVIIACDQMAYLKGTLFGKAHTKQKAIENLLKLQGHTHTLFSALYMLWEKKEFCHVSKSFLSMRKLTLKQIQNYIATEKPLKSAGSYHVEGKGITLFKKIQTDDLNSIEGLPLSQVINQLIRWGYPLWDKAQNS